MITRDVSLDGFTATDWVRLGHVFAEPGANPLPEPNAGGVVAVFEGQRLQKLLHTTRGRLELGDGAWPIPLDALGRAHRARWAVALEREALSRALERVAQRLLPEHDYLEQTLELFQVLRELEVEGALAAWPRTLASLPVPTVRMVSLALDLLCADGYSVALGVFAEGGLYTSLVARRRGLGFERIVGPDELRAEMGLLSGDFRRDYRHFVAAAERHVGPLALGCFAELGTLQRLSRRHPPGAWAAAVAAREIVLSPSGPALGVPLGIDAGRAALAGLRTLVESSKVRDWLGAYAVAPLVERAQAWFSRDLSLVLGFDPWQVLSRLFSRDRREP